MLDDAASSAQVAPLLPGSEGCSVLVTSRRQLGDLPGATAPVLLKALAAREAEEMFIRLARHAADGPQETVAELAELAGCLPLAISLLARVYAWHPSWTLADLATETRARMLTLTAENDSVATAFAVSYQHLAPGLKERFRSLSLHPGTSIDSYAAAALFGCGIEEAAGQLAALHGEGLLTEAGHRRYDMHDLIRRYARDLAADDPAAAPETADAGSGGAGQPCRPTRTRARIQGNSASVPEGRCGSVESRHRVRHRQRARMATAAARPAPVRPHD